MKKPNSSPYSISEFSNGFFITGKDREPVEVIQQPTYFQVKLLNLNHILEFSFYEFQPFTKGIAIGLLANWKTKKEYTFESGYPKWKGVYQWTLMRTAKALSGRVHTQWNRLLSRVDPRILSVHKSMFAATFSGGEFERIPQLYDHVFIINDINNYRAAAIAARNIRHLIKTYRVNQSNNHRQLLAQPEPYTMSYMFKGFLNKFSRKIPNPDHNLIIEAMHDWQDLFSITGQKYRSLSRTLMNLPGGVPHGLLCGLPNIHLNRPVTNRLELLLLLHFYRFRAIGHINANVIHQASGERIKRAIHILAAHQNSNLSSRRSSSVFHLANYLFDFPDKHHGNVVGLIERSIEWHRNQYTVNILNQLEKLGLETQCSIPPIPLPDIEGVDFLGKVKDVGEEAIKMGNCVASYARQAVNGHCYLLHITHQGEEATVEVDPQGKVIQAYGPRNFINSAAKWGRRILGKWGKDFPEARSISSTCADAGIFDEGDEIPF